MNKYVLFSTKLAIYLTIIFIMIDLSFKFQKYLINEISNDLVILMSPIIPFLLFGFIGGFYPVINRRTTNKKRGYRKNHSKKLYAIIISSLLITLIFVLLSLYTSLYTMNLLLGFLTYGLWIATGFLTSQLLASRKV